MHEHVALGVIIRRLLGAFHLDCFGHYLLEKPGGIQQAHCLGARRVREHLLQFRAYALGADLLDERCEFLDGAERPGLDFEAEPRRETHRAHKPQMVLQEARARLADGADGFRLDVRAPANEVQRLVRDRVVEKAVDGEVAPLGVLLRRRERDRRRMAAVDVRVVGAECGDLDLVAVLHDDDDSELRADLDGAREERRDLLRPRAGGHVVVVGRAAHNHVAHAAAGEVGREALLLQAPHDALRRLSRRYVRFLRHGADSIIVAGHCQNSLFTRKNKQRGQPRCLLCSQRCACGYEFFIMSTAMPMRWISLVPS